MTSNNKKTNKAHLPTYFHLNVHLPRHRICFSWSDIGLLRGYMFLLLPNQCTEGKCSLRTSQTYLGKYVYITFIFLTACTQWKYRHTIESFCLTRLFSVVIPHWLSLLSYERALASFLQAGCPMSQKHLRCCGLKDEISSRPIPVDNGIITLWPRFGLGLEFNALKLFNSVNIIL